MPKETLRYSKDDITVVWKPKVCIHSKLCWQGLREVFDPLKRPWVNMDGASAEAIIEQVSKCPSGALSIEKNGEKMEKPSEAPAMKIQITGGGPLIIKESCILVHEDGREEIKSGTTALCRCGASSNKPFCDGSHNKKN